MSAVNVCVSDGDNRRQQVAFPGAPETRLPTVTSARLIRPEIGARISVYARSSFAFSSAASAEARAAAALDSS